ncbi:ent-kaurene oxidase [Lentithecium fluviatile CBS 122367]|uniref:Ent-kaurene oxidase n=1 Tax=Lentithecium fluviatile CBS 122367 TaxID=1168545 RepID=A0A6G1JFS6_9PLEO|nr:ent-kaurene oxidase [Lentithecium fluviatile CBS 122367]
MDTQTLLGSTHALQTVVFATLFLAVCLLFPTVNYWAQLSKLPALGSSASGKKQQQAYMRSAKKLYREGYEKFKDAVYRVGTADGMDNVVIAPRFLQELKKLPDSVLSFGGAIEKTMETKYTGLLTEDNLITHSIKADLTPGLSRLNPVVYEEVELTVHDDMPACEDWTAVPIYKTLVTMVAKISGRIFVGAELCRNKDYLDCAINYTMDLIDTLKAVKHTNPWLRPILAPRLPEYHRLQKRERLARDVLVPIVRARQDAEKKNADNPNWQRPDDMLSWFMSRREEYGVHSTEYMAKLQLGLIFAAIHTTTMTATNILYDLAASDGYIEPLREEIRKVMAENGGTITTRALQQMVKLDSYMKESMRFHPPGVTAFSRKVLKGFTLSNGQYIPAGVTIEVPSDAVYHDSENYDDPETFDGFRFAKIRAGGTATDHARNQFVTTNEQNLLFGYGRHACPGRFFAANEIKMIVARLLLDFDFKNEDGGKARYKNIDMGRQSTPDPRKKLLFKRVKA